MRASIRKKLFRKRVLLPAVGLGLPWLWIAWQCFGPLWPITISPETTRLTDPLTADGRYIDFLSYARGKYEHDDAKPAREDPWCLLAGMLENTPEQPNNLPKFQEFQTAYDSWLAEHPEHATDGGRLRVGDRVAAIYRFQLSANSHPEIQKFLATNEAWFSAVENSTPTSPVLESSANMDLRLSQVLLNRTQWYRIRIVPRFSQRAALRFNAADFERAVRDMQVVMAAADGCEKFCLIGLVASWGTRKLACEELVNGLAVSKTINVPVCRELLKLPTELLPSEDIISTVDAAQRFVALDWIQVAHRTPEAMFVNAATGTRQLSSITSRYIAHRIDFDELLTLQNRYLDFVVAALRMPDYRQQVDAMSIAKNLTSSVARKMPRSLSWDFLTGDFQSHAEQLFVRSTPNTILIKLPDRIARQVNARRVLHLATRLAIWKNFHGSYPDSLSEVLEMPELPDAPARVLLDAFTDRPFHYERTGEQYRIRSAGPDMELETTTTVDDLTWPSALVWPQDEGHVSGTIQRAIHLSSQLNHHERCSRMV
jgi:hypothetical protein